MNEDFLPFELAVKLKEKGFREECIATYDIEDKEIDFNNYILRVAYQMNVTAKDCLRVFNNRNCGLIDAPTISQVLKWLREEKKVHLIVEISDSGWYYTLYPNVRWENGKLKSDKYIMSFKHKASYEQAALAGIEYVLDNLI